MRHSGLQGLFLLFASLFLHRAAAGQAVLNPPLAETWASRIAPGEIRLVYLGNAGWEITDGRTVILVDPYISQFARYRGTPSPAPQTPDDFLSPDTAELDRRIRRADYILITHGHVDHSLDAPYISRKTGAPIIGHESMANLARAHGVNDSSLITVRGGEDFEFGSFSLKVIPSIHSALSNKRYYTNRGSAPVPPGLKAPLRRSDHREGGTFAYLLRIAGHEILIMGGMNYIEREMERLHPDVALIGANSQRRHIHDYTGRLLRALGRPPLVVATHSDAYGNPSPSPDIVMNGERFKQEVTAASPRTRVILPKWFEPIVVPARK